MRSLIIVLAGASLTVLLAGVAESTDAEGGAVQSSVAAAPASPDSSSAPAAAGPTQEAAVKPGPNPPSVAPAASSDAASSQPITLSITTGSPPAEFKPPAGYKTVKNGLETVYCKSVVPIGSRMPEKVCLTRQQLEQAEAQAEQARRAIADKVKPGGTYSN